MANYYIVLFWLERVCLLEVVLSTTEWKGVFLSSINAVLIRDFQSVHPNNLLALQYVRNFLLSCITCLIYPSIYFKDVRANCFCASLLRTKFIRHVMHRARALSSKEWTIIGKMAIAMTLRGFNVLGRSVTPIFLLLGHFLYRFSTFCEKKKKIYRVELWIFCKTLHRMPFIWLLRFAVRQFQMPL